MLKDWDNGPYARLVFTGKNRIHLHSKVIIETSTDRDQNLLGSLTHDWSDLKLRQLLCLHNESVLVHSAQTNDHTLPVVHTRLITEPALPNWHV